ncbi:MAG: bifunctional folylpolyglutamate synthase/dihydrofolate synthase [Acidimicrobiia bacterium]
MSASAAWAYDDALAWLDEHVNLEASGVGRARPTLDRMRRLAALLGDPQAAAPVIHLTGTNGKGSTTRMIAALLAARGLSVGAYTSPDLERVNERMAWNGGHPPAGGGRRAAGGHLEFEPVPDPVLAEMLGAVAALEPLVGERPSRFEILTAAAFRWFADVAVDAAVVEVGMGGSWDATNVADGVVAVVTNVSLDHAEVIGPTEADIAREKAGIVKPGSTLVLGETDPELAAVFREAPAGRVLARGDDFAATANRVAHGGRLLTLRTPSATYEDVYLPVHGAHQGDNAAAALAAAEAFFDAPLPGDVVAEAFASLRLPGRMEVLGRRPLVVLDGAHNVAGARVVGPAVSEAFGAGRERVLVAGMLRGRRPAEILEALGPARLVVACPAPSPRSLPAADVAAAARALGMDAVDAPSVPDAVEAALAAARPDDLVLVTGSLYVVGAARTVLRRRAGQ